MERLIITILLGTPLLSTGQTLVFDSLFSVLGVKTVHTTITQNGKTTCEEYERYVDGTRTAFHYSTPPGKYNVDVHDTFIIRGGEFYSCIDRGDRDLYDSSNTIHTLGFCDTTKTTYFKNGQVVIQTSVVATREKQVVYHVYADKNSNDFFQTEQRFYDESDRLIRKATADTSIVGKKKKETSRYVYSYSWENEMEIMTVRKASADTMRQCYSTFHWIDNSSDSTVMFTENGSIEYTSVIHYNAGGRDTLSITRNGLGEITNLNTRSFSQNYSVIQHADGKGFVFKTHEYFTNEKGLVVKEVETDYKFGDVRTTTYDYTYY